VPNDPEQGGLRNSIYAQQTASGRRLTPGRLRLYKIARPIALALMRMVWNWGRVVRIVGEEHISAAIARAPSFIPVYWHQHQLMCGKYMFQIRAFGVKPGILVSPSVDGEFGAMLVRSLGGEVIRGSSSHTGARALRDFYQALVKDSVSPVITPDGPKGPAFKFKPGALLLAQIAQRPIIPFSYYAHHAWKIAWDRFVIPWPGTRIVIAVGEPVYVAKNLDAAGLEALQVDMEHRLAQLFETAKSALALEGTLKPY
jgi:lysophospholipid acyltransferase (LPLAT)-like uncharacterized protein